MNRLYVNSGREFGIVRCVDGRDGLPREPRGRSPSVGWTSSARAGQPYPLLRPSAVYGPRETALRDLFVAGSRGLVPLLAGGKPRVQMVFAKDVAAAVLGAIARGGRGETYFVAHPEVLDYRMVADTI